MLKEVEQLLVLQDRDKKIRTFRQELKTAPIQRKQLDEKLAASQAALEAIKQKSRTLEVERNQLANETASKREQIRKYETQKQQTRKNDEFQALNTAIEHLERDIAKLEDRELEIMEGMEALKPQIAEAEQSTAAVAKNVASQQEDIKTKVATIEGQIKGVEADRAKQAEGIDEDLLAIYERLFATKGEAVVALEHETCTGCHMKVTTSTVVRTKGRKEVVHCEQCGRILYWSSL